MALDREAGDLDDRQRATVHVAALALALCGARRGLRRARGTLPLRRYGTQARSPRRPPMRRHGHANGAGKIGPLGSLRVQLPGRNPVGSLGPSTDRR